MKINLRKKDTYEFYVNGKRIFSIDNGIVKNEH